ncbi:Uncharacterized protein PBTT_00104 [Plasmodiophora brassicae]
MVDALRRFSTVLERQIRKPPGRPPPSGTHVPAPSPPPGSPSYGTDNDDDDDDDDTPLEPPSPPRPPLSPSLGSRPASPARHRRRHRRRQRDQIERLAAENAALQRERDHLSRQVALYASALSSIDDAVRYVYGSSTLADAGGASGVAALRQAVLRPGDATSSSLSRAPEDVAERARQALRALSTQTARALEIVAMLERKQRVAIADLARDCEQRVADERASCQAQIQEAVAQHDAAWKRERALVEQRHQDEQQQLVVSRDEAERRLVSCKAELVAVRRQAGDARDAIEREREQCIAEAAAKASTMRKEYEERLRRLQEAAERRVDDVRAESEALVADVRRRYREAAALDAVRHDSTVDALELALRQSLSERPRYAPKRRPVIEDGRPAPRAGPFLDADGDPAAGDDEYT